MHFRVYSRTKVRLRRKQPQSRLFLALEFSRFSPCSLVLFRFHIRVLPIPALRRRAPRDVLRASFTTPGRAAAGKGGGFCWRGAAPPWPARGRGIILTKPQQQSLWARERESLWRDPTSITLSAGRSASLVQVQGGGGNVAVRGVGARGIAFVGLAFHCCVSGRLSGISSMVFVGNSIFVLMNLLRTRIHELGTGLNYLKVFYRSSNPLSLLYSMPLTCFAFEHNPQLPIPWK